MKWLSLSLLIVLAATVSASQPVFQGVTLLGGEQRQHSSLIITDIVFYNIYGQVIIPAVPPVVVPLSLGNITVMFAHGANATEKGWAIYPQDIFYRAYFPGMQEVGCSSAGVVVITNPLNGSTYYWAMPSVSVDINYTITGGGEPYHCEYRINNNAWNVVPCALGNNTVAAVTMPEGYPVVVTVRVNDTCASYSGLTQFSVVYRGGYNNTTSGDIVFIGGGILFLFVTILGRRRYFGQKIQRI